MAGRVKNASRNILFGLILKIYQIAAPFLTRTLMIHFMSVEYTGLNGLFTSILHVLNLAELGVGSAMVYSMYKPIVEKDNKKLCILLNTYRTYYRIVGGIIAAIGLILTPFIPYLIKGNPVPDLNIYILYLMSLGATILSYWLFAYKSSIIQAHQRNDVISKINIASSTVLYVIQIASILFFKNYYIFVAATIISQILTNTIVAIVSRKMYPDIYPKGKLGKTERKEINKRIKDLFTAKVGSVIVNSADTLVISVFLGVTMLAIYQNYFYIITALNGIMTIVYHACMAGIGNSVIVESKEKNYNDLRKFTFIVMWLVGLCSVYLLCLYQPFIELWVGKDLQLEFAAVICLALYFFVYQFNQLLCTYKDAAGIWHEDRYRPLITALANLFLNLITVQFIGIYGVILSTVLTYLFIGSPWLVKNLFSTVFERKYLWKYMKKILFYAVISTLATVLSYYSCIWVNGSVAVVLIVRLLICTVVVNVVYFACYFPLRDYRESKKLIKKVIKRKD